MSPSTADERLRGRLRQPLTGESTPTRACTAWDVLAAISDTRRKRAAHALLRADRDARHARAAQQAAETEAARLRDSIQAIEREWHRGQRGREALGLALRRASAEQAQREVLAAKQSERVRLHTQDSTRAGRLLEQARERYRLLARKDETLRALRQRLDIGDIE